MSNGHIHIIGAGMAGLSAALHLSQVTSNITLYDAAGHAGGRCRSYYDRELGCRIDNGNHLVMSGNVVLRDYLALSEAEDTVMIADKAEYPFMDVSTGQKWSVAMNDGLIPFNLFSASKRVPNTKLSDYKSLMRVMRARGDETVADLTKDSGALYPLFWEPLAVSVLNTTAEEGSARLLGNVLRQTFALGGKACKPVLPRIGLSETFVDPCLITLAKLDIHARVNRRVRALHYEGGRVKALEFVDSTIELGTDDWVILAVPPWVAAELVPQLTVPNKYCSILNAHYRADIATPQPAFAGIIGGVAEWIFVRHGIVSVTVSAADRYDHVRQEKMAADIWQDVAALYGLDAATVPLFRIVKEKRATFAATPEQIARRPNAHTQWRNLVLAGDWTDNDLPSTIEGALRTGLRAAQTITRWIR